MMRDELYRKYNISKVNGDPINPNADYLVLRLDNDFAARNAALTFALEMGGEFGLQLIRRILSYDPAMYGMVPDYMRRKLEHF